MCTDFCAFNYIKKFCGLVKENVLLLQAADIQLSISDLILKWMDMLSTNQILKNIAPKAKDEEYSVLMFVVETEEIMQVCWLDQEWAR